MKKQAISDLVLVAEAEEGHVYGFLEGIKSTIRGFAMGGFTRDIVTSMKALSDKNPRFRELQRTLIDYLKTSKQPIDRDIRMIFVLNPRGKIIAATDESELGSDESEHNYFIKGLTGTYIAPIQLMHHGPEQNKPHIPASAPIRDRKTGALLGVIVNFYDAGTLDKILSGEYQLEHGALTGAQGRRRTLDIYLVNKERVLITTSRFGAEVTKQRVDTFPVKACAEGREISDVYKNYRGVEVIGASMCIPAMGWTLLVEIDAAEAFQPIAVLRRRFILLGGGVGLFALVLAHLIAHGISGPVIALSKSSQKLAEGDFSVRVPRKSADEVGEMADAFNRMAAVIGEKTARLEAFGRVTADVTMTLNMRDVLDRIMEQGMLLTGSKAACVAFYDEESARFKKWHTRGLSDHFVNNMAFRPGGLADEAFSSGGCILSSDRPETKHRLSRLAREEAIRAFVCLPLESHRRRQGVLYFYRDDRDEFTPDEIALLTTFSHLAAGAIENAGLYEKEQHRVWQMSVLQEAVMAITSDLALEPLLERLATETARLMKAELAALVILNPENGSIQHFETNVPPEVFPVKFMPEGRGLLGAAMREGAPVRVQDVASDSRSQEFPPGHPPIRNLIEVPLQYRNRIIGELLAANKESNEPFTQEDEDLLLTLAVQSATAVENARLYAMTVEMATMDSLTGLNNRRVLQGRLDEEIERSDRYQHPFAVLMIDIDHFKQVNDTFGHAAGDSVLRGLARILKSQIRNVDIAGRYGGEEFVVILPETDRIRGKGVAEQIREGVSRASFLLSDGRESGITVSVGVTCYPECSRTAADLIDKADQALYIAKKEGRDRVRLYSETLKAQLEKDPSLIVTLLTRDLGSIETIVTAVDAKMADSRRHSEEMERYSIRLGRALGLPPEELQMLHQAALLHDIGILSIPDALLNKVGELSSEEWEVIKRHPVVGAEILEQVPLLRPIAPLVRRHQERYDGSGYPDGLKGESIPYMARIMAIADAYSAMTTDRPHRKACEREEALRRISAGAGTQFDPEIVAAFMKVMSGPETKEPDPRIVSVPPIR